MSIVSLNVGSTSIKYTIYDDSLSPVDSGSPGDLDKLRQVLNSYQKDISAFAHRVVHGGDKYYEPTEITEVVFQDLTNISQLAPLHNPPALMAVRMCLDTYANTPSYAIFDTDFYKNLPPYARLYPIPTDIDPQIKRYGFHGTSHRFVAEEAAKQLGRELTDLKIISVHLGGGCSITATENGEAIDTSMGFTPLEGLMMATRSGTIDPGIIFYLIRDKGYSVDEVEDLLNNKSGLLGVSGVSIDPREIIAVSQKMGPNASEQEKVASAKAGLALQMYAYQIRKYIGAYYVALGGLDALVFTGQIGSGSQLIREMVINGLEIIGDFKTLIIETDENLSMARQIKKLIEKQE